MLFEYVIEVTYGSRRESRREFVDAPDRDAAKRYAHTVAAKWYPGARHDRELDVFTTPNGAMQWTVARVAPVSTLSVSVVDERGRNGKAARVALVPCRDLRDACALAARVLRALANAGLMSESLDAFKTRLGANNVVLSMEAGALERVAAQMRDV
jgi:hypothetical protein